MTSHLVALSIESRNCLPTESVAPNKFPVIVPTGTRVVRLTFPGAPVHGGFRTLAVAVAAVVKDVAQLRAQGYTSRASVETTAF